MSERTCQILITRLEGDMHIEDSCETACLRLHPHWTGPHVFKTKDGRYFSWEDDECGCCEPEDTERCFVYEEISETEALKLLKKRDY